MKLRVGVSILLALAIVLGGVTFAGAQTSRLRTPWLVATRASIGSGSLIASGSTSLQSTTATTLAVSDLTIADDLIVTEATALSVTNGTMYTLTAGIQPLTSAGTVTPTLGACTPNGQVLILTNDSNTTINFAVTGNQLLASAWAGTQYATLTLYCDGTKWREVARGMN